MLDHLFLLYIAEGGGFVVPIKTRPSWRPDVNTRRPVLSLSAIFDDLHVIDDDHGHVWVCAILY